MKAAQKQAALANNVSEMIKLREYCLFFFLNQRFKN